MRPTTRYIHNLFTRRTGRPNWRTWMLCPRPATAALRHPCGGQGQIDVCWPASTAWCPAFSYIAMRRGLRSALLAAAGAIVLADNLDQFATGLVRHPFTLRAVPNALQPGLHFWRLQLRLASVCRGARTGPFQPGYRHAPFRARTGGFP